MRVAVLGGKLQGVEAVYLAKKAGWQVVLVDKDANAPAVGLCDSFRLLDLMDKSGLLTLFSEVDFVIPALEDKVILDNIYECALLAKVRVVYDPSAYLLSSSKLESDKLFAGLGIPAPKSWPECGFPVTVKPSGASGSADVHLVGDAQELEQLLARLGNRQDWVIQEFLAGPSYSIEIAGNCGDYRTFQVTELAMDEQYDCKRVLAPALLSQDKIRQFAESALTIAEKLNLNGIMDVEVILHNEKLKVLEIDARLPSQTLTAVFKSTGVNVLEVLWSGFGRESDQKHFTTAAARGVIYEHIKVAGGQLEVCGEHIMANAGHLQLFQNFFGADEAISNYCPNKEEWVATLIITAEDRPQAWQRRCAVVKAIMDKYGISRYKDITPPMMPNSGESDIVRG